jgi:hypothetical protein
MAKVNKLILMTSLLLGCFAVYCEKPDEPEYEYPMWFCGVEPLIAPDSAECDSGFTAWARLEFDENTRFTESYHPAWFRWKKIPWGKEQTIRYCGDYRMEPGEICLSGNYHEETVRIYDINAEKCDNWNYYKQISSFKVSLTWRGKTYKGAYPCKPDPF